MPMRIPELLLPIAAASCLACGCASTAPAGSGAPSVEVYPANPYVGKQYEVLGPVWAGSWRTALRLPTYPTKDEAVAALRTEAAQLNADALISVSCLDQGRSTWFTSNEPGFLCYGVAIRVGRNPG